MKAQLRTIKVKKSKNVSDDWENNTNEHVCITVNYSKSRKRLKYGVSVPYDMASVDDHLFLFNSFEQAVDAYKILRKETSIHTSLTEGSGYAYRPVPSDTIDDRLNKIKWSYL